MTCFVKEIKTLSRLHLYCCGICATTSICKVLILLLFDFGMLIAGVCRYIGHAPARNRKERAMLRDYLVETGTSLLTCVVVVLVPFYPWILAWGMRVAGV